jgi:hypothetical protein
MKKKIGIALLILIYISLFAPFAIERGIMSALIGFFITTCFIGIMVLAAWLITSD